MTALLTFRSVRLSLVREPAPVPYSGTVRTAADVATLARAILADDPREGVLAFYLDNRHKLASVHRVSVGTCGQAPIAPREVFGPALQQAVHAVVLCHNHPSGDPMPSTEDRLVTERMRSAADILGLDLLDHVVLGAERYFSFASCTTHAYGGGT
jgi:DNA repair protein RadC